MTSSKSFETYILHASSEFRRLTSMCTQTASAIEVVRVRESTVNANIGFIYFRSGIKFAST